MSQNSYTILCIKRAVDYIQRELEDGRSPALEEIAGASNLSKFHFHRLYKLLTGESCLQTVKRLKLARAASTLTDFSKSITQIAQEAGYGSSQAFAKAMKKELKDTPSAIRADRERLTQAMKILCEPKGGADVTRAIRIELASLEPFKIMAVTTEGQYPQLHSTYGYLFEAVGDPEMVEAIIGRPYGDIEPLNPDRFEFECGLYVPSDTFETPKGLHSSTIEGGTYLVTRNVGAYEQLSEKLDDLYLFVLANETITLSDTPCVFHYLDDPEQTQEADLRTDIYMKVDIDD